MPMRNGLPDGCRPVLAVVGGRVNFWDYGNSQYGFFMSSNKIVADNNWHYIVGVRQANGTGQIYIDRKASLALRAAAQGLITFITYGAGMFVGSWLSGAVVERYTTTSPTGAAIHAWQSIWLVAASASAVVLVLFLVTFTDKEKASVTAVESAGAIPLESPL